MESVSAKLWRAQPGPRLRSSLLMVLLHGDAFQKPREKSTESARTNQLDNMNVFARIQLTNIISRWTLPTLIMSIRSRKVVLPKKCLIAKNGRLVWQVGRHKLSICLLEIRIKMDGRFLAVLVSSALLLFLPLLHRQQHSPILQVRLAKDVLWMGHIF